MMDLQQGIETPTEVIFSYAYYGRPKDAHKTLHSYISMENTQI